LLFGSRWLLRKLIVSVAHTIKKSSITHIYNVDSPHSGSNKVRRFSDTTFTFDNIFGEFVKIHSFTHFQKNSHT